MPSDEPQTTPTDDRQICDYPLCSVRGSGHPLACNCRSASATPQPTTEPLAVDLKPCPFCGSGMHWRRSMQAVHPENDCVLSGMMFRDFNAEFDALGTGAPADHCWNRRTA